MRCLIFLALLGFQTISQATAKAVVLEEIRALPPGWHFISTAKGDEPLSLAIALAQPKLAALETHMLSQAHRRESRPPATWHLSRSQLRDYQAPHEGAADAVLDWLAAKGVQGARTDGPWVQFTASVDASRALFEADVEYYAHEDGGAPVLRALLYTVPESLAGLVDFVYPLAHFMPPANVHPHHPVSQTQTQQKTRLRSQPLRKRSQDAGWGGYGNNTFRPWPKEDVPCAADKITPGCIREMYNWPLNVSDATNGTTNETTQVSGTPVRLGIAGFLNQYANSQDAASFLQRYAPAEVAAAYAAGTYTFDVQLVHGGQNVQVPRYRAGIEASLDVQYALALAYPEAHVTYYSTGGRGEKLDDKGRPVDPRRADNEPYLDLLEYLVGLPDTTGTGNNATTNATTTTNGTNSTPDAIPQVLSVSYSDDEQSVPRAYAARVCGLFLQLAARGVTTLVASGDGGSRGIGRALCVRNDGSGQRVLLPTFPASCPWVTAVGATALAPPPPPASPPEGAGDKGDEDGDARKGPLAKTAAPPAATFSSGGFSDYFARPAWQDAPVAGYLAALNGSHSRKLSENLFNQSGRAVPDLAAVGQRFQLLWGGTPSTTDGTSAATPVVAAMVAAANARRLAAGKPPLGWLNPVLYSERLRDVLQDIVVGVSTGCPFSRPSPVSSSNGTTTTTGTAETMEPGWPAAAGWDAVTGLGVPSDVQRFAAALLEV